MNPRFYIKEKVPKFLRYDYDRHYEEYCDSNDLLKSLGRVRCYARLKDSHFTLKERLQRYICRVMWLYRNCGYGFAFYCFGRLCIGARCERFVYRFDEQGHYVKYIANTHQTEGNRVWMYKSTWPINDKYRWEIYLGWKINEDDNESRHCMIANRIAIRKMK